jgi:fucokinase
MEANAAAYRRVIQTSAPGDCWDFLVLTAANEKQALGYRQELALRSRAIGTAGAFFPAIQRAVVVPDPPGRRAGSGGATLGVLDALHREHGVNPRDFQQLRILLIHSGGASQRLPAYSPVGKIFSPLPLLRPDGQIATLFDHLYLTLAGLPQRLGPGMLVLAGDVVLIFDHRDVQAPPPGVTAITMRVEPEVAQGHGVFVTDANRQITHTLQKVSPDAMRQRGATDAHGRVQIDTGILFFDPKSVSMLAGLVGADVGRAPRTVSARSAKKWSAGRTLHEHQIDLYEDITAALAVGTEARAYRNNGAADVRSLLWRKLHGIPFQASPIEGEFLHLGTTRQFRDAMIGQNRSPAAELLQQNVLTHTEWSIPDASRVYHSVLLGESGLQPSLGAGSVIEHSVLGPRCVIGAGCVVSQATAVARPLRLANDRLFFQTPVHRDGGIACIQVICGVEDDFKGRYDQGKCIYLNRPIELWLTRNHIKPADLWKGIAPDQQTLWTARLFPATAQRDAAALAASLASDEPASAAQVAAWRKAPRYSMAMVLAQANPAALIEHREVISANLQTRQWIDSIRHQEDRLVDSSIGRYASAAAYEQAQHLLEHFAAGPAQRPQDSLDQARALWSAAQLLARPDHPSSAGARLRIDELMNAAFAKIAQASETGHASLAGGAQSIALDDAQSKKVHFPPPVLRGRVREGVSGSTVFGATPSPALPRRTEGGRISASNEILPKLRPGLQITATAPVRLDLAGGWSDTPPYCYERGGHVVNVAIDLDGHSPVRAIVRTIAEPKLVLESHDLGQKIELTRMDGQRVDVQDHFALQKVALGIAGLLPPRGVDLSAHLRKIGAGLHVITEARVPKGSGLGTSSILAAALLAALQSLHRKAPNLDTLIEQTLLLEQRLSTGGGWQDQVGGIVSGVKSSISEPGVPQRPQVETLDLSETQLRGLEDRLVVFFSGQQRLARDILRRVMGRWLAREPAVVMLNHSLKQGAAALRAALLKGRWAACAQQINQYWQIKKELYPGSTTPAIDLLLLEHREHYLAAGLAGAGGGGFAYFLCKDAPQAQRLRQRLADHASRPGNLGAVYRATVNRQGLVVQGDKW